jgi:hypothetical protein
MNQTEQLGNGGRWWRHRPSFADVGPIVVLIQQARGVGLTISDTQIVETQQ